MMSNQSISVIIPVYNAESFLSAALNSVLRQDMLPAEIIVIDDGSTDETTRVMEQYKHQITAIHQSNQGPAAARNVGLEVASGNMIAFLDADDLWPVYHLRLLAECLHESPDIGVSLGHIQHIAMESTINRLSLIDEPFSLLKLDSALIRKSVLDRVGFLDESLRFSEDVDWFMRAREAEIQMMLRQDVILYYRRHDANMTNVSDFKDLGLLRALKNSIVRRRQANGNAESLTDLLIFEECL